MLKDAHGVRSVDCTNFLDPASVVASLLHCFHLVQSSFRDVGECFSQTLHKREYIYDGNSSYSVTGKPEFVLPKHRDVRAVP